MTVQSNVVKCGSLMSLGDKLGKLRGMFYKNMLPIHEGQEINLSFTPPLPFSLSVFILFFEFSGLFSPMVQALCLISCLRNLQSSDGETLL